ncbi:ATP-binding protein [Kamptonema animale CS-326]|jgi:hypothetical protein|uniref:ATP-binding protein n=1 Tax=Kamptonema animale TaxID=92934 RepID=UPI00232A8E4B|nr:ATP-binding protein [Kamptonema animale]MDB9510122.1 ATP-binding protein [Kamptonema animale CS-326]
MPPIDLANIKTRLIGCGAIQLVGQTISTALSVSTGATAGIVGGPIAVVGVSALGAIAASVAGGMMATELGNQITERLSKNRNILDNHDLTLAAGEAIAYILKEVAQSDRLIAIAETKNLPYQAEPFNQLANKAVEYWLKINTNTADLSRGLRISEAQLNLIFSAEAEEFDEVTGLTAEDWQIFLGELAASQGKSFDVDVIQFVANRLYESFPKAFREVLKDDAKTGGQKFAAMVLNLHQIALGELKDLGLQTGEVLQKLEAVATQQQVCDLINKLDAIALDIRDDLAQVKASLQRLVDTSATRLPLPYECETIIQDSIQDFTGREFVFDAITQFLQQNPKGYFVLEAEPGVGKSAIMAKLVLLLNRCCVAHFNSQSQGTVKAEQFLKNACTQLIQWFKLDYPQLPENATEDGNFLIRLLGEVRAKLGNQKLIFVVDALDEVDLSFQGHNSNVLYLPDALPDNVYFIVSKRPEFLPLPVNHRVFDLMKYDAESLVDVKAYLEKRTDKSASIQSWINHQNLQREEFVTAVAEKSEKKFIYLRYVLDEIESGDYKDVNLNDLPAGLQAYYQKHWGQMMGREDDPLLELKVNIIYKLSQAREPVSCRWLAKSVRETAFKVQQVLRKWDSFLRQQQVNSEIRYSIYHNSFRQFLEADETVQAAGITLEEINRQIMDNLTEGSPK